MATPSSSRRSHPAQNGEGFNAPPTIERSGSEHRVGRFPSSRLRFLSPANGGTEGGVNTVSSIPFSNRRDAPYSFSNLRAPSIISSPHHLKDSKKSIISVYEFPYMGTLIYFNFPIFATWFRDTRCSQSQIGQNLCKSVKSVGQRKTQISSKKICEIPDRIGQRSASSAKSACLYPIDRAGICENL